MLLLLEDPLHNLVQNVTLPFPLCVSGITSWGLFHTSWHAKYEIPTFARILRWLTTVFFGTLRLFFMEKSNEFLGFTTQFFYLWCEGDNWIQWLITLRVFSAYSMYRNYRKFVTFRKPWSSSANSQCANYSYDLTFPSPFQMAEEPLEPEAFLK